MSKKWYWNLLDWFITKTNHDFYPSLIFHLLEKAYSPENKQNEMSPENSNWLVQMYIFPSEVVPLKRGHSFVSGGCYVWPPIHRSDPSAFQEVLKEQRGCLKRWLVRILGGLKKWAGKFLDGYTTPRSSTAGISFLGESLAWLGSWIFLKNHPDETRSFKLKVKHTKPEVEQRVCPWKSYRARAPKGNDRLPNHHLPLNPPRPPILERIPFINRSCPGSMLCSRGILELSWKIKATKTQTIRVYQYNLAKTYCT